MKLIRAMILATLAACAPVTTASPTPPPIPTAPPATLAAQVGILAGRLSIGPLTPVERVGVPTPTTSPELYAAWPIGVFQSDGSTPVTPLSVNADGTFRVELPPGMYVVRLMQPTRIGGSNLPQTIILAAGQTVTLDISIDTGIR